MSDPTASPDPDVIPVLMATSTGPQPAEARHQSDPPALLLSWLPTADATLYGLQLSIGPGQWSPLMTFPPALAVAGIEVRATIPVRTPANDPSRPS